MRARELVASFAEQEPPASSLGTPFLADTEATQALVQMGQAAIPALREALGSDNPKIVLYAAYTLGQMGDASVLPDLQAVRDARAAKEPKEAFDYGIVSVASKAIENLK